MSNPAQRRKARHYAMQALYQWQLSQLDPKTITEQFAADYDMKHVDFPYFSTLVMEVSKDAEALDRTYEPHLQGHSLAELDPITRALLRIATFELQSRIDVPFKVVISEAVALAKKFGATDSHKFINAVLDSLSVKLRDIERAQ